VRMVGAELQGVNWKVPPEDVKTIARELVNWEAAIRDGYRARLRTKVSKSKLALAQPIIQKTWLHLHELRDRIFYAGKGRDKQIVSAKVVDPGLRDVLGESIPLNFDKNAWFPARFLGQDVTVFLEGEFDQTSGEKVKAPLLVKFPEGKGTVIFTSFHNEKVNS